MLRKGKLAAWRFRHRDVAEKPRFSRRQEAGMSKARRVSKRRRSRTSPAITPKRGWGRGTRTAAPSGARDLRKRRDFARPSMEMSRLARGENDTSPLSRRIGFRCYDEREMLDPMVEQRYREALFTLLEKSKTTRSAL